LFCSIGYCVTAQNDTIHLTGRVFDTDNPYVRINYFVVNKRLGKGVFGDHKGQFVLDVLKRDSLVVSSKDYYPVKVVVRDSCRGSLTCELVIGLRKKEIELRAVDIIPVREHSEIVKNLKELQEPSKIEKVTADALTSPITAIYQAFSKLERQKHQVAVLEAEDRKREVLKELLTKYLRGGAIDLDPDNFDDFLDVAQFDVDYLSTLSDYHLITYVQYKVESYNNFKEFYEVFRRLNHNQYDLMLREAKGEKMGVTLDLFRTYIDRDVYSMVGMERDFVFEFINYSRFNIADLIQMSDYGMIATVSRKYEQFKGLFGFPGKR
jgi:hypothetical protein